MNFVEITGDKNLLTLAQRNSKPRVWRASAPDGSLFQITCMLLKYLENRSVGIINYLPGQEPKDGPLHYGAAWIRRNQTLITTQAPFKITPLIGPWHGGWETYREAEQMCRDVWRAKGVNA